VTVAHCVLLAVHHPAVPRRCLGNQAALPVARHVSLPHRFPTRDYVRHAPLAPATLALCVGEATAEDEEAEYAWLPAEALKVFHVGDGSGAGDGLAVPDANLASCIAAAERAVVAEQRALEAVADGELDCKARL